VRENRQHSMKWLFRLTYLYLLIPFILFCLGWLRLFVALPIAALMLWVFWRLWSPKPPGLGYADRWQNREILQSVIPAILLTGLWVFLSGVGGYAFQNWDHHWRNAVLRDLITYDWPVIYSSPETGPIRMLVYYVGYWLPAALAGKLLGWQFANFFLFLWTWLGIVLVALHLSLILKTSALKTISLLIFFSGMDAFGALLLAGDYPTLWPTVQHLEIWGGNLQYSSFTTQLFWVFNQAVPAWLCIAMFVTLPAPVPQAQVRERSVRPKSLMNNVGDSSLPKEWVAQNDTWGQMAFIWSLCFFFAPLASVGLLPYLLIEWLQQTRTDIKTLLKGIRVDLLLAGAVIVLISYLFFSSNTAAQERGFQALELKDVLVFFLLEGGILWLLFAPRLWRDPRWVVTGLLLFTIPFIQFGSGRDFVMRASIVPLFYLMLWSGQTISQNLTTRVYRIAIALILVIGALTPLYEINRSIYRTFEYYFVLDESERVHPISEPVTHLEQGVVPESEHPGAILADGIQTLKYMDDELSRNFIANVRRSIFYQYLASH
jgi:hypothetical protein